MPRTEWIILGKEFAKGLGPFLIELILLNLMNSLYIPDEKSLSNVTGSHQRQENNVETARSWTSGEQQGHGMCTLLLRPLTEEFSLTLPRALCRHTLAIFTATKKRRKRSKRIKSVIRISE